ncbi:flagellar biosynthesis protein FlgI [Parasphingorhabdus halotolerans]|uniref:Flagellar biosynthesis protein FlgI n=2 Tax=Parasphingorhabdus halotolerans TaxID=2725558 RepID=A0A6H2DH52_9SPHN|nr:flagellar biosynthesis protein FlgI [Parasphingorhabdus halotolerans]
MTVILSPSHTAPSSLGSISVEANKKQAEIQSMAADFEAIFVRQMLKTMRTSSLGEGLFDGQGTEQFREMQDAKVAESMAQKGVFGIAQLLARHVEDKDV